ncbi:MAG: hypothetical protein ABIE43_02400 [Patescibacteria group bacterium]
MLTNNYTVYSIKIFTELIRDVLYFPFWWYSRGLGKLIISLINFLSNKQKKLALLVWIKNIHRPMYGQYDWPGILISFIVRLFQILMRSLILLFWLIIVLAIFCFWIIFPIFIIYEIFFQLAL